MIDIAQLREALHGFDVGWGHWPSVKLVLNLAEERLTQLEAGALIITPDENGEWPEWAMHRIARWFGHNKGWSSASQILDALRDAKPDGDT